LCREIRGTLHKPQVEPPIAFPKRKNQKSEKKQLHLGIEFIILYCPYKSMPDQPPFKVKS